MEKTYIAERLVEIAQNKAGELAVKFEKDSFIFQELLARVYRLVNALKDLHARSQNIKLKSIPGIVLGRGSGWVHDCSHKLSPGPPRDRLYSQ